MKTYVHRYHDFCIGHVRSDEAGACSQLHGHNIRVTVYARAKQNDDKSDIEVDFAKLKILFDWIEVNWDHRFLIYKKDLRRIALLNIDPNICTVNFNPTSENMARRLIEISDMLFHNHNVKVFKLTLQETRKCGVTVEL